MRQPRPGEVMWRRVPGGRALHAITCDSWPNAICGVMPHLSWRIAASWSQRRKHKQCDRLAPRGRINFWPPDYEE
jgi:hypothetical protein